MAIQPIVRIGNPSLREISSPLLKSDFGSPWLLNLVQDLWDSQNHYGGVGIAAPQIGVNRRVIVFGFETTARYKNVEPVPLTVLCNPEIKILDASETEAYEGCLSVGDLRGMVLRAKAIEYSGFDEYGLEIKRTVADFHARLVLHEVDHIDGIVFLDRVKNTKSLGFRDELSRFAN